MKKLQAKKLANPEKYIHETSDRSKFLAMDYDYKNGVLPPFKEKLYFELKEKFEKNETKGTEN